MKLGEVRTFQRITWKEWVRKFYKEGKEYTFGVMRIWKPMRYPSYRLDLIELETKTRVTRTVKKEVGDELMKELHSKGQGVAMRLKITKDGEVVTEYVDAKDYIYADTGRCWQLQKKDEVPF